MAKDTKDIVIEALISLAAKQDIVTVEDISRYSGITRNTIQKNFNNQGINGIVDYINHKITTEINTELMRFDPDELPLEIFADITLTIMWKYRREAHVLYTSNLPFKPRINSIENSLSLPWVEKRYEALVKAHNLAPIFTASDLLYFWNSFLYSVFSLWLSSPIPVDPKEFKPKFIYLVKTSIFDLIYKDIGVH
nr:TetR/AcrR family transcriptional regulator [Lactococcus garvieae]